MALTDYLYNNSVKLALLVLVVTMLGFVAFSLIPGWDGGMTPVYFRIAMPAIFIGLLAMSLLPREKMDCNLMLPVAIGGFALLYLVNACFAGIKYDSEGEFSLVGLIAIGLGGMLAIRMRGAMLSLNEIVATGLVLYAKIALIYLILALIVGTVLGGQNTGLLKYIGCAAPECQPWPFIVDMPAFHMAVFLLSFTAAFLLWQGFAPSGRKAHARSAAISGGLGSSISFKPAPLRIKPKRKAKKKRR